MGDRIETGTFCVAATLAKGDLLIKNFNPKIIQTELELLKKTGAKIKMYQNKITYKFTDRREGDVEKLIAETSKISEFLYLVFFIKSKISNLIISIISDSLNSFLPFN